MDDIYPRGNISKDQYEEFISNFDPRCESLLHIPETWCMVPIKNRENVLFSKRIINPNINIHFYCRYDEENESIIILVKYIYLGAYNETADVLFEILDYKKNTYNHETTNNKTVCFAADEDIITMISHFDNYMLSIKDTHITFEQFKMYLRHLYKNSHELKLLEPYNSEICSFQINIVYEYKTVVVRIYFEDKKLNVTNWCDFLLYKNRIVGDEFNNIDTQINRPILERLDEIFYDFQLFSLVAFE